MTGKDRKKENTQRAGLKASLGLFDAAVSVGAIVGGGIFVVTGIAAGLILSYGKKVITALRLRVWVRKQRQGFWEKCTVRKRSSTWTY